MAVGPPFEKRAGSTSMRSAVVSFSRIQSCGVAWPRDEPLTLDAAEASPVVDCGEYDDHTW